MADSVDGPQPERVPDTATLYLRAHKDRFDNGELQAAVFRFRREHEYKESADWAGYKGRTPQQTRADARKPQDNAIISVPVGPVREIEGIRDVEHAPIPDNHAHCHVVGDPYACSRAEDLDQIRLKMYKLATIVIPPDSPV